MRDQPNPATPAQARTHKRCPACKQHKPVSAFYTTPTGAPSGYCKDCQRAVSRRSRRRRTAALRALIATDPEAWRAALRSADDADEAEAGGDSDVA
jgi:hypothetical protein